MLRINYYAASASDGVNTMGRSFQSERLSRLADSVVVRGAVMSDDSIAHRGVDRGVSARGILGSTPLSGEIRGFRAALGRRGFPCGIDSVRARGERSCGIAAAFHAPRWNTAAQESVFRRGVSTSARGQ